MRTRSSAAALAVVLVLLARASTAPAHPAGSPLTVALELERTRVGAYLRYTLERGELARAAREQFDRDQDGRLDESEQLRLRAWLVERARAGFGVSVAGVALAFRERSVSAELEDGADARLAVGVRLIAPVKWRAGASVLQVTAELPDARAVTPIALRDGRDAKLELPADFAGGVASKGAPLEVVVSAGRPAR